MWTLPRFAALCGIGAGLIALAILVANGAFAALLRSSPGDDAFLLGPVTGPVVAAIVLGGPLLSIVGGIVAPRRRWAGAILMAVAGLLLLASFGRVPQGLAIAGLTFMGSVLSAWRRA